MSTNITGLNTLGFIKDNSLTYTEIQEDITNFIEALSEDEKLGFKTLFEGTNSQILIELLAAKSSDEIYQIITSRSENLLYYLNRKDSAIAISQNSGYSVYRGSNIKLRITLTPSETAVIPKMSSIGVADSYDLITMNDLSFIAGESQTFDVYVGSIEEQTLIANSEDLLVFRFTNSNISEQICLYLNGEEVPHSKNMLDMTDDKYFCITNAYQGVDAIYLNKRTDFTHRYTSMSELTLKYIKFEDIMLNSLEVTSIYGDITSIVQAEATIQPESITSIKINAPLYAETENRIVARDDFKKVLKNAFPILLDTEGHDYSNAIVEVTYVKKDGQLLTPLEYEEMYNYLYKRRAFGIPMCLLEHPDVMLNLKIKVVLKLISGTSAIVQPYVKKVLANHELQLGSTIDFSTIEQELELYEFVKTARILPMSTTFATDTLSPEGVIYAPTEPNGKLYVVRNALALTGSIEPSWPTTIGNTITDNDIIWTCEAKSYVPYPSWEEDTAIRLENIVRPTDTSSDYQYRCTGFTYSTGTEEPIWPTVVGDYITDNQIQWVSIDKNESAETWTANTIVQKGTIVNATTDSDYSFQAINYIPRTPAEEPEWLTDVSLFTDGPIQYVVIDEEFNPLDPTKSDITLNWNQYVIFDESIEVV